ncbi:MAG: hypothetical protein J5985_08215 [Kiritimatiellae bacterium]|nr:hypothetical protein [Kiritimatiellia bacterium]
MKRIRVLFWATAFACTSVCAELVSCTPTPQNAKPESWWMKRHAEKMECVKKGGSKVVFIGDSITNGWEHKPRGIAQWEKYFAHAPYHALNLGYSADRTEHVLWRIAHGELDGYEAKAVVLMIGTNNTGQKSFAKEPPADTIVGIKAVLDAIREKQPKAKIILHPIFPRGATPDDPRRKRNEIVNEQIFRFVDGKNIVWCDFNAKLLELDGTLSKEMMPDFLHPKGRGYEIWAKSVIPFIDWALDPEKVPEPPRQVYTPPDAATRLSLRKTVIPATRMTETSKARGKGWWEKRLREKRASIQSSDGTYDIVFFGDSITHFWERSGGDVYKDLCKRYKILNIGYGGDHTEHLVWRGLNGELDGYKAKLVMLMIGTNNRETPADIAAGVKRVIEVIEQKQPEAKVLLLPIFPRGKETPTDANHLRNLEVNKLIRPYADGGRVLWCDFNAKFLDKDGKVQKSLMPDYLHPGRTGYAIWRDAVLPVFRQVVGK